MPGIASQETIFQLAPLPRQGGFRMEGYWVWCGSAIRGDDGRYHLFASRGPREISFHPGWMACSEVVRAVAEHPAGPYEFQEVVLPSRAAEFWDGRATHNPSITRYDDTYVLYYMGSTHPLASPPLNRSFATDDPRCIVARASKRVGIAISKSLAGPWQRFDEPILPAKPGTFDSFLTSNPAPWVNEDGSELLIFKSRQYNGNTHSPMMLGLTKAAHFLGPYRVLGNEPLRFGEVEDLFLRSPQTDHATQ